MEVAPAHSEGTAEAVVAPWANTAEASLDQIDVESTSATDLVSSESEDADAVIVELPESSAVCQIFDLSPRVSQALQQSEETPLRGPPSVDPEEIPDSKRRRPRSGLRLLTSPVLRQAASFAADGLFEDYEGMIFKRSASGLFPSLEMIFMTVLQVGQTSQQGWLLSLADIRHLTACSKR